MIIALWEQVVPLTARLTALEQRLEQPKTPDTSSLPPSKGQTPNRSDTSKPAGPRKGSLGRKGGGRSLMAEPDQVVSAQAAGCRHCGTALGEALPPPFSPEVGERAVRMVQEHQGEHSSRHAAIRSIASKIGCSG